MSQCHVTRYSQGPELYLILFDDSLKLAQRREAFDDGLRCIVRLAARVSARHNDRVVDATILIDGNEFINRDGCVMMKSCS